MARKVTSGDPNAAHEYQRRDKESIIEDGDGHDYATLSGEAVGMSAEELLDYAQRQIREHDEQLETILRHVPRKHENRIKRLYEPRSAALGAIHAASILIGNARRPLEKP